MSRRFLEGLVLYVFLLYGGVIGVTRWEAQWILNRYREERLPW